jgi:hypothetical protein
MPAIREEVTREFLVRALARYARGTAGRISIERFCAAEGVSTPLIKRHFPGGYHEFMLAAGLRDRFCRVRCANRESLMRELERVASLVSRTPTLADVDRYGRVRPGTFRKHLGSWFRLTAEYERWKSTRGERAVAVDGKGANCPPDEGSAEGSLPAEPAVDGAASEPSPAHPITPSPHQVLPTPLLGSPLGFRGLLHAPTNELGVVHLFGLLSADLNIAVEHIGAAYPDCRALRPEPGTAGKWRRIAIEFELRSSNFKYHGHDPKLCDLVVCWEHDWPACPVEVLELKSVLKRVGK